MQKGNASAFDSPPVRFLFALRRRLGFADAIGRRLARLLFTVQGLGAFTLITLGVLLLAFTLVQGKGGMTGSFRGGLGVHSFYSLDAQGEDLVSDGFQPFHGMGGSDWGGNNNRARALFPGRKYGSLSRGSRSQAVIDHDHSFTLQLERRSTGAISFFAAL